MVFIQTYQHFRETLEQLPRRQASLLIAVDGCGGSGKTTFAQMLQKVLPDLVIVHMDDFYLPSARRPAAGADVIAGDFDWQRLQQQVLEPLSHDQPGSYQQYDWLRDELTGFQSVPVGSSVLIEGVYTLLPELTRYYDYTIWVECSYDIRLARGIERDGESARDLWVNRWMPAEDRYVEMHQPRRGVNLVVDGSRTVEHHLETEFVCLQD